MKPSPLGAVAERARAALALAASACEDVGDDDDADALEAAMVEALHEERWMRDAVIRAWGDAINAAVGDADAHNARAATRRRRSAEKRRRRAAREREATDPDAPGYVWRWGEGGRVEYWCFRLDAPSGRRWRRARDRGGGSGGGRNADVSEEEESGARPHTVKKN